MSTECELLVDFFAGGRRSGLRKIARNTQKGHGIYPFKVLMSTSNGAEKTALKIGFPHLPFRVPEHIPTF